jgi:hypothetical protein
LLEVQLRRDIVGNFRADGPSTTGKAHLALCNNSANSGYEYSNGVIKDTKTNITAMARTAGFTYYATDEQLYYGDDGTNLVSLGGGWPTHTAAQSISGGGTISFSTLTPMQHRKVVGNAGAVTLSGTPFGTPTGLKDQSIIIVTGTDDTNTVTLQHNDAQYGAILNGDKTLGKYNSVTLLWDNTMERFLEIGGNTL